MAEIVQLAAHSGGPPPVLVVLTKPEAEFVARVGLDRQLYAIEADLRDAYGANPATPFDLHIQGATGEFATSKALNVAWQATVGSIEGDDVGRFQVRTAEKHNSRLILRPADRDDRPFVLVTGRLPRVQVHGWTFARDGKRPEFWSDPNGRGHPAYWVPRAALRPLIELRAYIRREDDKVARLTG